MNDKAKPGNSDADPQGSPENTDEVKSLSQLLAEWPDDSNPDPDDGTPSEDEQNAARLATLERRANETDMTALVTRVKGDLDVDSWMVRAWILNEAANDPKMDALWDQRDSKSALLDKIVDDALIPGFKKYAEGKILPPTSEPDPKPKPNSALAAAVRGARESKSTPSGLDDIDWSALTPAEFEARKQDVFRAAKAGELNPK